MKDGILKAMETLSTNNKQNQKRGRPKMSQNVRVVPEFRENPDIEKLGRALLAVATEMAKKREQEKLKNDSEAVFENKKASEKS